MFTVYFFLYLLFKFIGQSLDSYIHIYYCKQLKEKIDYFKVHKELCGKFYIAWVCIALNLGLLRKLVKREVKIFKCGVK